MYSASISAPEPGRRHERERQHAVGVGERELGGDEAAHRVPDEVRALDALAVEEPAHGAGQQRDVAVARLLDRAAVARQVERVDGAVGASGSALNSQLLRSPPKPCRSTTGSPPSPWRRNRSVPMPTVTVSGCGPGVLLGLAGDERRLELGDERVDVGVGHAGVRDHGEQAADGDHSPSRADAAAQHAGRRATRRRR